MVERDRKSNGLVARIPAWTSYQPRREPGICGKIQITVKWQKYCWKNCLRASQEVGRLHLDHVNHSARRCHTDFSSIFKRLRLFVFISSAISTNHPNIVDLSELLGFVVDLNGKLASRCKNQSYDAWFRVVGSGSLVWIFVFQNMHN